MKADRKIMEQIGGGKSKIKQTLRNSAPKFSETKHTFEKGLSAQLQIEKNLKSPVTALTADWHTTCNRGGKYGNQTL